MTLELALGLCLWLAWWIHSHWLRQNLTNKENLARHSQAEVERLEQRLSIRSRHLDHVMNAIQELVLRIDEQGMVTSANQQAQQAFSCPVTLRWPQPMVSLYRDYDWLKAFHHALQSLPEAVDLPEIFINQRVYLPRLSSLGDNQAILLCLDMTQHYRLQEQRKAFTSNLMHDLKTPLTSLLGYARIIESFSDDPTLCKEAATVIAQESKHVNELLNSLLSVEQIEYSDAGDAQCDAVAICQQVWQGLATEMDKKELTLSLDLPESFHVAMQESDLTRIITNVAANAIRYTHVDTVIQCWLVHDMLTIVDEGDGVSEKDLPHLTERFYRVDSVRMRGSGHGLGLAIVKETLDRDGGSLFIENSDDGGLSVCMQLPIAKKED